MSLSLNTCLIERRGFILLDRDIVSTGIIVKSNAAWEKVLGHLVVMFTVLYYSEALVLVFVIVICFGGLVYCGWWVVQKP